MPFIRGRYHINPIAGAALEAAREAEEGLKAREGSVRAVGQHSSTDGHGAEQAVQGPIHRVEIEAAEVVPSHSGRGQRGFVARIHRASGVTEPGGSSTGDYAFAASPAPASERSSGSASYRSGHEGEPAERHVFTNHQDLTDFLNGEFEKDSGQ